MKGRYNNWHWIAIIAAILFSLMMVFYDVHHFKLMPDVEIRSRLIEQKNIGLLRQCTSDKNFLLLTSAEFDIAIDRR